MIVKEVFIAGFLLLSLLTEIECQAVDKDLLAAFLNGSIQCNFNRKHDQHIDPIKINVTWYNPSNLYGISYTLDVASDKLIQNSIFWKYPSLNIYVSGYGSSSKSIDSISYRNAFLTVQKPIILIDYSAYSGTSDPGYLGACYNLYNIGGNIAEFLIDMVEAGVKEKNIHLMGGSLGAQLVSNIASAYQRYAGANVGRATGIDPAGPCFDRASKDESLKKEDADFVDIYHFNRGQLGTVQILGHANILVNGGGPEQKSCETLTFINILIPTYSMDCAHGIVSIAYWKSSILDILGIFKATKCDNLDQAIRQECHGSQINVGLDISLSARGIFHAQYGVTLDFFFSKLVASELFLPIAN